MTLLCIEVDGVEIELTNIRLVDGTVIDEDTLIDMLSRPHVDVKFVAYADEGSYRWFRSGGPVSITASAAPSDYVPATAGWISPSGVLYIGVDGAGFDETLEFIKNSFFPPATSLGSVLSAGWVRIHPSGALQAVKINTQQISLIARMLRDEHGDAEFKKVLGESFDDLIFDEDQEV